MRAMEQPAGIGGNLRHVGSESNAKNRYYPNLPRKQNEKSLKIKKGEILSGTVTETISGEEIFVRLPIGTFRAHVSGRLKKGDSLFFIVKENADALYLSTYSVPAKSGGAALRDSEIIRILDLPDTEIAREAVSRMKMRMSQIVRTDALLVISECAALAAGGRMPLPGVVNALIWMLSLGFAGDKSKLRPFLRVFGSGIVLLQSLSAVEQSLKLLPGEQSGRLSEIFESWGHGRVRITGDLFPEGASISSRFVETIAELCDRMASSAPKLPDRTIAALNNLRMIFGAVDELNKIMHAGTRGLIFIAPLAVGGIYLPAVCVAESRKKPINPMDAGAGLRSTLQAVQSLIRSCDGYRGAASLAGQAAAEEIKNELKEFASYCYDEFLKGGFLLRSMEVSSLAAESVEILEPALRQPERGFEIVV